MNLAGEDEVPAELSHWYYRIPKKKRFARLVSLLRTEKPSRAIIFTEMKHETEHLAQWLGQKGEFEVGFLNGNMPQMDRNKVLAKFRSGEVNLLVATDVAARGIDIDDIGAVIHYEPAPDGKAYLHRSGRTARAGKDGWAVTLAEYNQHVQCTVLQRALRLPFTKPIEVFSNNPKLRNLSEFEALT